MAVDRGNFKTCEQASFCKWDFREISLEKNIFVDFRRHRNQAKTADYEVDASSVKVNETGLNAFLTSTVNSLKLEIVLLEDNSLRIVVDEKGPSLRPRFQPTDALDGVPKQAR